MKKKDNETEEELKKAYCNFCQSHDVKVTKIIKVQCRGCGKTRLITSKIR